MKKTLLTATFILTAPLALAEDHAKGTQFNAADANSDGFLTETEMMDAHRAKLSERFSNMDTDGDGKLSQDEMRAGHKSMRQNMRQKWEKWKGKRQDGGESEATE